MILTITTIILGILVVVLGFTTFNLLRKVESLEDYVVDYNEFVTKLRDQISSSTDRLKQIDQKGTFEGDDEIGWFFNEVKIIQNELDKFSSNK
jgi:hypothetical protein|tara:strand:+ start:148 stop:426 length:279 start_codon:yes stop_codon:yes gene_type:complete